MCHSVFLPLELVVGMSVFYSFTSPQEQISVQLTEEQKTVSGVTGILQSLAEVPGTQI